MSDWEHQSRQFVATIDSRNGKREPSASFSGSSLAFCKEFVGYGQCNGEGCKLTHMLPKNHEILPFIRANEEYLIEAFINQGNSSRLNGEFLRYLFEKERAYPGFLLQRGIMIKPSANPRANSAMQPCFNRNPSSFSFPFGQFETQPPKMEKDDSILNWNEPVLMKTAQINPYACFSSCSKQFEGNFGFQEAKSAPWDGLPAPNPYALNEIKERDKQIQESERKMDQNIDYPSVIRNFLAKVTENLVNETQVAPNSSEVSRKNNEGCHSTNEKKHFIPDSARRDSEKKKDIAFGSKETSITTKKLQRNSIRADFQPKSDRSHRGNDTKEHQKRKWNERSSRDPFLSKREHHNSDRDSFAKRRNPRDSQEATKNHNHFPKRAADHSKRDHFHHRKHSSHHHHHDRETNKLSNHDRNSRIVSSPPPIVNEPKSFSFESSFSAAKLFTLTQKTGTSIQSNNFHTPDSPAYIQKPPSLSILHKSHK